MYAAAAFAGCCVLCSWGLNFAAPMVGCRLVLPGAALEGAALYHLIQTYKVSTTPIKVHTLPHFKP